VASVDVEAQTSLKVTLARTPMACNATNTSNLDYKQLLHARHLSLSMAQPPIDQSLSQIALMMRSKNKNKNKNKKRKGKRNNRDKQTAQTDRQMDRTDRHTDTE